MIQFHESRAGRKFLDGTMPRLVEQLEKLNDHLAGGTPYERGQPMAEWLSKKERELAIILAGLRCLQREAEKDNGQRLPHGILDILANVPSVLTDTPAFLKEIDELCEELNS